MPRDHAVALRALFIAVWVAGVVPAAWNLTQLEGLRRPPFMVVYFLLGVALPLVAGLLVATVWPNLHPAELVLGALGAGAVEAIVELGLIPHITVRGQHLVVATEDYVAWTAISCMFAAGGLYALARKAPSGDGADDITRRDVLMFATKVLGFVGGLISVYKLAGR
jgi:hypothetical protein